MGAEHERHILIVSGSVDIQKILRLSLEMSVNWTISTISSVGEGLALSAAAPPDAILLNADLLEMDAQSALQALQNHPVTQHSRVIVIASRADSSQQRQFRQLGAVAVISNPFSSFNLAQQVAAALGWSL